MVSIENLTVIELVAPGNSLLKTNETIIIIITISRSSFQNQNNVYYFCGT